MQSPRAVVGARANVCTRLEQTFCDCATLEPDSKGGTPLHYAIDTHAFDPELWERLIALGCSIEDKNHGDSLLHTAVSSHNVKATKWFLEKGADKDSTNSDGQSVVEYANELGNAKLIALLK